MKHAVVARFIDKVRQSQRARARILSLSMEEAQDLCHELGLVLLRENELLEELSKLKTQSASVTISMSGGSFGED